MRMIIKPMEDYSIYKGFLCPEISTRQTRLNQFILELSKTSHSSYLTPEYLANVKKNQKDGI